MRDSFYERRVFPWMNDLFGRAPALQELRRETLASASGRVIEVGFGTGANLQYYPAVVTSVTGVEPSRGMTERAVDRVRASRVPVRVVEGVAEALPAHSASYDAAVSTLTLCSVRNPHRALEELHRVLRPGGVLFVLEHGLSPDPAVARWQQRLNGLQRLLACGCNLDRPMSALIADASFEFEHLRTFAAPGVPRVLGWITAGRAIRR